MEEASWPFMTHSVTSVRSITYERQIKTAKNLVVRGGARRGYGIELHCSMKGVSKNLQPLTKSSWEGKEKFT